MKNIEANRKRANVALAARQLARISAAALWRNTKQWLRRMA